MNKILKEKIREDYSSGIKREDMISKYNNLSWTKIYFAIDPCLKKNGDDLSDVEKEDILRMYKSGISAPIIAYNTGYYHKVISKIVKTFGEEMRETGNKIYDVDKEYFSIIDTPNKAYVLGFIYADGAVMEDANCLQISLQERDYDILEKIKSELCYTGQIKYSDYNNKKNKNWSPVYRLSISSKDIVRDLVKHGVVQNKSLVLSFPKIDESLYSHFIRGYFDGDGCLFLKNEKNKIDQVSIASTESFCKSVYKILIDNSVIYGGGVYESAAKNGITKLVRFGGEYQVKNFCDWIYNEASIYLDRKYNCYIKRFYSE